MYMVNLVLSKGERRRIGSFMDYANRRVFACLHSR
ncbi:hypothetical protein [Bacteriophage sp.]|nr:hypothetical protein [Bacteriophage sp.]